MTLDEILWHFEFALKDPATPDPSRKFMLSIKRQARNPRFKPSAKQLAWAKDIIDSRFRRGEMDEDGDVLE